MHCMVFSKQFQFWVQHIPKKSNADLKSKGKKSALIGKLWVMNLCDQSGCPCICCYIILHLNNKDVYSVVNVVIAVSPTFRPKVSIWRFLSLPLTLSIILSEVHLLIIRFLWYDNRPSTDKLHQFVRKKIKIKKWHMTLDMWHLTREMLGGGGGEHSIKISAP